METNYLETNQKITELVNEITSLELKLEETTAKLNWYEEQFRLLQQQRFGA